jgi:hypothetical protein
MTSRQHDRIVRQIIGVLLVLLVIGCRSRSAPPVVTTNAFFEQALLATGTVRTGEEQTLHLILRNDGGSETIFQLTIIYANGVEQRVIRATIARETTISWNIPPDAGVGRATFHLTTTGCGARSVTQVNTILEGSAEGGFYVR